MTYGARIARVRREYDEARYAVVETTTRLQSAKDSRAGSLRKCDEAREDRIVYDQAREVLERVSTDEAAQAQKVVADLVTAGIQAVFGSEYRFVIESVTRRGNQHLDMWIARDGKSLDVVDSHGGGLAAVVSFLLRVVVVVLEGGSRTLVLDEPFAHLSRSYVPRLAAFLRTLVDKVGVQLILVSHVPELAETADRAYRFRAVPSGVEVTEEGDGCGPA